MMGDGIDFHNFCGVHRRSRSEIENDTTKLFGTGRAIASWACGVIPGPQVGTGGSKSDYSSSVGCKSFYSVDATDREHLLSSPLEAAIRISITEIEEIVDQYMFSAATSKFFINMDVEGLVGT